MGLGQTMLTIMALMLMGRLILSINSTTLDVGYTKDMAEYRITATSLGTSMLEQSSALAFDERTVDSVASSTTSLTVAASLGTDATESSVDLYDDIDDYNNYMKYDTLTNSAIFKTRVRVAYANVSGTDIVTTTTRTFSKEIVVEITSDYLIDYSVTPSRADTLRFKQVFSYWYFR
ncbi:MAG: hypothetical protein HYV29_10210 [Ignavibacteriales bacterium]|nr:hypothetical protein [Ignavibacteriales bacterium]